MTWDKPKSAKGWLLLLAPASCCVLATLLGALVDRQDGDWMGWALAGLAMATFSSAGLSLWLARVNTTGASKVRCAIVCFVILMTVNGAVSFAGCAVGWSTLPAMNFH